MTSGELGQMRVWKSQCDLPRSPSRPRSRRSTRRQSPGDCGIPRPFIQERTVAFSWYVRFLSQVCAQLQSPGGALNRPLEKGHKVRVVSELSDCFPEAEGHPDE